MCVGGGGGGGGLVGGGSRDSFMIRTIMFILLEKTCIRLSPLSNSDVFVHWKLEASL